MAGVIIYTAGMMIAADNLWHASWARMKSSLALAVIGGVFIAAGMI